MKIAPSDGLQCSKREFTAMRTQNVSAGLLAALADELGVKKMDEKYFKELIDLLHAEIRRLEREKDEKRREIDRLKSELKKLQKEISH